MEPLLMLFVLLQPQLSAPPFLQDPQMPATIYQTLSWTPSSIAALLVGFAFAAIAYIAGEFLGMPSIRGWVKAELYEHGVSVFILLMTIAALITLNGVVSGFLQPDPGGAFHCDNEHLNPAYDDPLIYPVFSRAQYFLGCRSLAGSSEPMKFTGTGILLPKIMNSYVGLMGIELILGVLSTLSFSIQLPIAAFTAIRLGFQPMIGMTIVSEAHIMLLDFIAIGMGSIIAQKVLLQFIQESLLTIFLPLGLLFRALPLTRKTGSTIIAVCLAGYFIYPLSILINAQIYVSIEPIDFANYQNVIEICNKSAGETDLQFEERLNQSIAQTHDAFQNVGNESYYNNPIPHGNPQYMVTRMLEGNEHFQGNVWNMAKTAWNSVSQFGPYIVDPNAWSEFFFAFIIDTITPTMQLIALMVIFLVNSIVLTVTFFRDISTAIGGEPRLFGVSKLI